VRKYVKHIPRFELTLRTVELPKPRVIRVSPVKPKPVEMLRIQTARQIRKHKLQVVPLSMITLGLLIVGSVLWPMFSSSSGSDDPAQEGIRQLAQLAESSQSSSQVLGVQTESDRPKTKILDEELDFTDLSSWFPDQSIPEIRPEQAKTYSLEIPSLKIEQAIVKIGGLNLDQNLIHYPGTGEPGALGSPVIFGHSTSPIFYNPSLTNPKRYTSIFTRLMTLKPGEVIILRSEGKEYLYEVVGKKEVKPQDVSILEQTPNERTLKLVTCVPPGTILRRGIVTARLKEVR